MSSNVQPIRPVTGVWPPCPPAPCPPANCWDPVFALGQCWDDAAKAKAILKRIIADIIACDPSIIGRGTPIVGVTDGSDAQPGMVGEWIKLTNFLAIPVTPQSSTLILGTLPAGDWDCTAYAWFDANVNDLYYEQVTPLPPGWTDAITGVLSVSNWERVTANMSRALTSEPTVVAFQIVSNQNANGTAASQINMVFQARRRR